MADPIDQKLCNLNFFGAFSQAVTVKTNQIVGDGNLESPPSMLFRGQKQKQTRWWRLERR